MADIDLFDTPVEETAPAEVVQTETPAEPEKSDGVHGFGLKDGKLVMLTDDAPFTKEENDTPKEEQVPTYEIVWNGQKVVKQLPEIIGLAQQGFDYTQKTQALSAKQAEIARKEAELQQIIQIMSQQPTVPQVQEPTQAAPVVDNIEKAVQMVMEQFQTDEYDPLDLRQQAAFVRALNSLDQAEVQAKQQQDRVTAAVTQREQTLVAWEAEQRQKDPEYDNVIDWGMPKLKQILRADQYEAINEAFRVGNTVVLTKGIDYLRKMYQAEKIGVPTTPKPLPPMVQAAGTGKDKKAAEKRDASELRSLDQEGRIAWIKQHMLK